ncbi:MAG: hypothetical protein E6Q97_31005 [Desulfurellales bacterium]|nr:MAG: hypothetical protein E6Q97_31005 [Desulfurellales bacterium]
MKLSAIKSNPKNPRLIRDEKFDRLKKSLESFPQMMELRPIVVDADGVILGGNMRYQALKALGKSEIPDEWVKRANELTEEQKREFIIKDNAGFGEWDWDLIANEWDDLPLSDWGLDVTIEDDTETRDAEPQIDEAAELNKKWRVEIGDLWQIGEHRLLCGDSTNPSDVATLMQGDLAHLIWTDPPYGVAIGDKNKFLKSIGRSNRVEDNLENDTLDDAGLAIMLDAAFSNAVAVSEPGASWYVAAPPGPLHVIFGLALKERGIWRQTIQWVKNNATFSPMSVCYHWQAEPIFFGWLPNGAHKWYGGRQQTTVWQIDRPSKSAEHPTMKPVELVQRAVQNSSQKRDNVYEPFAGSGTTLVACQNLDRKCYAIEISESYCAVILERMKTAFPDLEIKRLSESAKADELNTNDNKANARKLAQSKANNA